MPTFSKTITINNAAKSFLFKSEHEGTEMIYTITSESQNDLVSFRMRKGEGDSWGILAQVLPEWVFENEWKFADAIEFADGE